MFVLLSRVLLWLLIAFIIVTLFQRFYPAGGFIGRLILVIFLVIIALSFVNPNEPAVASMWRVISFPLKPLGASILLLIFGAQRMKGGGLDKPGGYLIGWALAILLIASTPALAYFLVHSPVAMIQSPDIRLVSAVTSTSGNFLAVAPETGGISPVVSDTIVPYQYLLQTPTPQAIPRRGLRLEDFVPNAQTLSITTTAWESYLNEIYIFLHSGRR